MIELFKFRIEMRIPFEDVDLFRLLHNAKYFSYFEKCRFEYLRNLGLIYGEESLPNVECAVVEHFCSYKKPARYDDVIEFLVRVSYIRRSSLQFQYILRRKGDEQVLTTGYTNLVWVNFETGKPKTIPPHIKDPVVEFEGDNLNKMPGNPVVK
ncbi:acyl-CoA thioesterase [candidate division KSB1 bacterium]